MMIFMYFLLIAWTMFWFLAWVLGLRHDLARVRVGPRDDLFTVFLAYASPAMSLTITALFSWCWFPIALFGAMWLAG